MLAHHVTLHKKYTHTIINMQLHWEIEHSKKQRRLTQPTGNLHHSSGVHKREQAKLILLHLHPSLQVEPHTNGVFQQVILTKACWKRACWTASACRIDCAACQIVQCQTQSIRILAQSAHIASVETAASCTQSPYHKDWERAWQPRRSE